MFAHLLQKHRFERHASCAAPKGLITDQRSSKGEIRHLEYLKSSGLCHRLSSHSLNEPGLQSAPSSSNSIHVPRHPREVPNLPFLQYPDSQSESSEQAPPANFFVSEDAHRPQKHFLDAQASCWLRNGFNASNPSMFKASSVQSPPSAIGSRQLPRQPPE